MKQPSDPELKQALTNFLPALIVYAPSTHNVRERFYWLGAQEMVRDSEWLHLVSLAEQQLHNQPVPPATKSESTLYREALCEVCCMEGGPITASWQQRVRALMDVKGILYK